MRWPQADVRLFITAILACSVGERQDPLRRRLLARLRLDIGDGLLPRRRQIHRALLRRFSGGISPIGAVQYGLGTEKETNQAMRPAATLGIFIAFVALAVSAYSQQSVSWVDPSPHAVRFVTVEDNVRLEVLDWGGTGRSVVLLAGGGNTAHVFDELAPKLTTDYHVYSITRRGFGASGFSAADNPVDRLRDDVVAVLGALKLERPVLVGHSIAGAELSAVASSHSDRVAGLIYLEAGYPYAFDNGKGPKMKEFQMAGPRPPNPSASDLASFSSLHKWDAEVFGFPRPEAELRQTWEADSSGRPRKPRNFPGAQAFGAIMASDRAHTHIPVPALVMFALPHVPESWIDNSTEPSTREAARVYYAAIDAATERQAKALEDGVPTARVVRMRDAHHIFLSNEGETLREMRAFLAGLK